MLRAVSGLANMPFGTHVLDFMGHMHPHGSLATQAAGIEWPARVGIGAGIALDAGTIVAFSHFGVGHIEVGPVTVSPVVSTDEIERNESLMSITYPDIPENPGLERIAEALEEATERINKEKQHGIPVRIGVRIANLPDSSIESALQEYQTLVRQFVPSLKRNDQNKQKQYCDFITVDTRWWSPSWTDDQLIDLMNAIHQESESSRVGLFILLPPDCSEQLFKLALQFDHDKLIRGFIVGGGILTGPRHSNGSPESANPGRKRRINGRTCKNQSIELVTRLASSISTSHIEKNDPVIEQQTPHRSMIIASGGIIEPQDAIEFFKAGADLIQIHSGFVFSGPGLPKRINECFSYYKPKNDRTTAGTTINPDLISPPQSTKTSNRFTEGWIGFTLVAIGLIIAAVAVIVVGLTRVLLPYDEAFLGVTMSQIPTINDKLLNFMAHDRVTLGGSSLSGAVIFLGLAIFGVRRRHHWAYVTEVAGLIAGFLAFFLYLGFKYFDPLHALVCLLVLPFFIWGLVKRPDFVAERSPNLHNSSSWRRSQIGQLLFVSIGAGLLLAGVTIAGVGCSSIFVNEDLNFMHTSRCTLENVNPRLLPLIAHDRASFGGCLWAVGTVELLTSLYGFRQGNRWVWWTLLLGGLPGFVAVMGIHFGIGYTDIVHLLPAYIAVAMFVAGLYLSYDYLCGEVKP